jgi:hypothetical protein
MPSKGKRVASRQNSLRRKRGTGNRQPAMPVEAAARSGGGPIASPTGSHDGSGASVTGNVPGNGAVANPAAPSPQVNNRASAQPRGRRSERPAAYNYVGSELMRIGIFSGVSLVILIAVSFVI